MLIKLESKTTVFLLHQMKNEVTTTILIHLRQEGRATVICTSVSHFLGCSFEDYVIVKVRL